MEIVSSEHPTDAMVRQSSLDGRLDWHIQGALANCNVGIDAGEVAYAEFWAGKVRYWMLLFRLSEIKSCVPSHRS